MKTFSQAKSEDGKFNLKLEFSDNEPSKLFVEVVSPKNKSVTVLDLVDAIYYNCLEEGNHSFGLGEKIDGLPCEVKRGLECRNIKVSWFNSYEDILGDIASQISL